MTRLTDEEYANDPRPVIKAETGFIACPAGRCTMTFRYCQRESGNGLASNPVRCPDCALLFRETGQDGNRDRKTSMIWIDPSDNQPESIAKALAQKVKI